MRFCSRRRVSATWPVALFVGALAISAAAEERPISPALVGNLRTLLDEGFQIGPKHLQAAQKTLAAARSLAPADQQLDYAWGLVLLKHSQHKAAIAPLEKIVGEAGTENWPAWQALIWSHFLEKQYDKGLARLDEFSGHVRQAQREGDPTDPQRDAARWIGRLIAALDRTTTSAKPRLQIQAAQDRLRESLGDDLQTDFDLGQEMLESRYAVLLEELNLDVEKAEKRQTRRRESQKNKLGSDLKDLEKQKEITAKTTEEWKAWLDEQLPQIDKEVDKLEKEYQRLQERSQSLQQSMQLVSREISDLNFQMNMAATNRRNTNATRQLMAQQAILQRQNQMFNYETEYNATVMQMNVTSLEGQHLMQQRAGIVQQYEKATGDLSRKNADIEKWSTRVADKKKKLDAKPASRAKNANSGGSLKAITLKSLELVDLEFEKARLLEACERASPAPVETGPKK